VAKSVLRRPAAGLGKRRSIAEISVEIDQLKNFLKVAEHGNFTRAAEDVGLSQPALSRSIIRLEQKLGQP